MTLLTRTVSFACGWRSGLDVALNKILEFIETGDSWEEVAVVVVSAGVLVFELGFELEPVFVLVLTLAMLVTSWESELSKVPIFWKRI